MKSKLLLAGVAAVALLVAAARFKPLGRWDDLDLDYDYEVWPIYQ